MPNNDVLRALSGVPQGGYAVIRYSDQGAGGGCLRELNFNSFG
jgi:hypothetical protein